MGRRERRCPNCERLEAEVARLREQLEIALARIAELESDIARLKKNSTTSSKPPSSDIVKPPRPDESGGKRRRKRRGGGQPGHARHSRPPFPPEQVDKTWIYEWTTVPAGWKPLRRFRVVQQVELVEKPYKVTEHRARLYQNLRTGQVQKASAALGPCHAQLQKALPQQASMGIDETGHPERGRRLWSWCFHVPGQNRFTWFHIDASRGSKVLKRYLGKAFRGIIGCDYYAAYRKFLRETNVWLQLCWAHLIRDVKYLATLLDRATRGYGQRLLGKIKVLFRTWHRRQQMPEGQWQRAAVKIRRELLAVAQRAPTRSEAQNIAKRFRDHGREYFTFLDTPGIEPTNNGPERQIRFLAIDRKITQGTRGEAGRRWCERIWTVLATCAQQGRSAFEFIYRSIVAYFTDQPFPSLLPLPP